MFHRGFTPSEPKENDLRPTSIITAKAKPPLVVVAEENINFSSIILIAIDAPDRPGLLKDISKALLKLHLHLHHTEASVHYQRSMSVWKCEPLSGHTVELEEISTALNSVVEDGAGEMEAIKKGGLQVIRAKINEHSCLIGKQVKDINFRLTYKAAIVSVLKGGATISTEALPDVMLSIGDVLILQVNNDSPLLVPPDADFYSKLEKKTFSIGNIKNFVKNVKSNGVINKMTRSASREKIEKLENSLSGEDKSKSMDKESNAEQVVGTKRNNYEKFDDIEEANSPKRDLVS